MISLRPVIWQFTRYVTPKRSFTAIARTVNSAEEFLQIQNENNNNFFIRGIANDDYEENFVKGCEYYEKNYNNFIETRQRNFTSTYGLLGKAVFLNNLSFYMNMNTEFSTFDIYLPRQLHSTCEICDLFYDYTT